MIGSLFSLIVQPAAERSADASVSSNACSTFRSGRPSISRMRPEKMFFLPFFSTVSRPCLIAYSGIACTQIAQGDARLHFAFEAHQNGFRHIQRHYACCGCKCHQTRTAGKRYRSGNGYGSHLRYRRYPAAAYGSARSGLRRHPDAATHRHGS